MKSYIAIDLKSFYASVECVERGLDPLTTNLVVADTSRTDKTICLAVSPSLKSHGISSRPRLFEVIAEVAKINSQRRWYAPSRKLISDTYDDVLLKNDPSLALGYIAAVPRMALYMEYSAKIYGIYLRYFAPEDIHVYSIDEVFIDATNYLNTYKTSVEELTTRILHEVVRESGITATAGIGTNLYLAKVAMDIVAKKIRPDKNGVRIANLDEIKYRKLLWDHRPLTDFWRVGRGYLKKLEANGMFTMGDIALMSLCNEDLLYKLFGINAELLIDHAWGFESCGMSDIKAYKPLTNSINSGQVLSCPYTYDKAKLIVREMCDLLVLDMVEKRVATNQITLTVGYDSESLTAKDCEYRGEIILDYYGRPVPKHAHGSYDFKRYTSSTDEIIRGLIEIFDRVVDRTLLVRRINISVVNLLDESCCTSERNGAQMNFFVDYDLENEEENKRKNEYSREKQRQKAVIDIKNKFGKNAILKGMNFEEGATTIDRNMQIGGHKA